MKTPELNTIICGDALETLKQWPDEFIDCIITSPPYWGLRDYGVGGQIGLEKTLNEYLDKSQPVIAKEKSGRGGINREHFIVIDNKLATTYGVKDPAWYNTAKLNEITDGVNKIRGYENGFDGLRLFYPGNGIADSAISLNLASPAEFLVTDPIGRRFGKDPVTNAEYNEIPDASYFTEGIDDPTGEILPSDHENKTLYIENPLDGHYDIKVIGTVTGDYTAEILVYDSQGQPHTHTFTGNTDTNILAS